MLRWAVRLGQGMERSAAAYVRQMLASTSGYEATLGAVLDGNFPPGHSHSAAQPCGGCAATATKYLQNGAPAAGRGCALALVMLYPRPAWVLEP